MQLNIPADLLKRIEKEVANRKISIEKFILEAVENELVSELGELEEPKKGEYAIEQTLTIKAKNGEEAIKKLNKVMAELKKKGFKKIT